MSVRQKTAQCLGKQLPEKPRNPMSRWSAHHLCWHEEPESSRRIQTSSSSAPVASERTFRSRERVKAWLEASPTSVLEDLDDESAPISSFESLGSSPPLSVDHLSCTTRFQKPATKINPSGLVRSRTISPPRCGANKNSVDLSRIDPAHYAGGSFLILAFKNAQYRGSSSPPVFQYTSGPVRDDRVQKLNASECGSAGREFSLASEWTNMLAAGNAAGMSTRGSSGNNSEFEVLNVSDLDLDCDVSNLREHPQVVRKAHRRTRSMEIPHIRSSGSGSLNDAFVQDNKYKCGSAKLERRKTEAGTIHDQHPLRRLSRRNSMSAASLREVLGVEKRKVQNTAEAWKEVEYSKLINGFERVDRKAKSWEDYQREKATSLKQAKLNSELNRDIMEKMQNDMTVAFRKAEEKKVRAEAKHAEKAARAAMEAKLLRRTSKAPRGCLYLV